MFSFLISGILCSVVLNAAHGQGRSEMAGGSFQGSGFASAYMMDACNIAGSFRLTLASMKCNCDLANTCAGGEIPSDASDCAAPSCASNVSSQKACEYQLGVRAKLGNVIDPSPGGKIDCSGFVSAGLCRAGVPFSPGKTCKDLTTRDMLDQIESKKSCFEPVKPGKMKSGNLMPGDLVVYPHAGKAIGHVFMIDRVHPTDCKTYSIIESGGKQHGAGISVAGRQAMSGDKGVALKAVTDVSCGGASGGGGKVKIVRFDRNKPGCAPSPDSRKLKNEACVAKCDTGRRNGNN